MLKNVVEKNPLKFDTIFKVYNKILGKNKFKYRNASNKVLIYSSLLKKTTIRVFGTNNTIVIDSLCRLTKCQIIIYGNNNIVNIKQRCAFNSTSLVIEDNNNSIEIGEFTWIAGKTELCAMESTKIIIGDRCMFSGNIHFRTGDSHSIIDENLNSRVNFSRDIFIGNHVWVGSNVTCLKGSSIADDSIIGYGSLVTKKFDEPNVVLAGVPAKIVRSKVNWLKERRNY